MQASCSEIGYGPHQKYRHLQLANQLCITFPTTNSADDTNIHPY